MEHIKNVYLCIQHLGSHFEDVLPNNIIGPYFWERANCFTYLKMLHVVVNIAP